VSLQRGALAPSPRTLVDILEASWRLEGSPVPMVPVSTGELVAHLASEAGRQGPALRRVLEQWLYEPGLPVLAQEGADGLGARR
jgi:hypothetical protein